MTSVRRTTLLVVLGMLPFCARVRADANGPVLYATVDPPVIWNDGVSTFTMQVVTTKTGIASVNFVSGGVSLPMYDDGTHGDLIAGDGIYTRNNLTLPPQPLSFNGAFVRTSVAAEIKLTNGKGQFQSVDFGLVGVGLDVPSTKLANGIYATPAAVFVVDPAGAANAGFTPDESVANPRGGNFLSKATHALYSVFGDIFDIVVAMPGRPIFDPTNNVYGVGVPYCNSANNQIQNIGLPILTDTTWGSKGRLQAVIYHNFGEGAILTHEIGHRWMAFAGKAQNLSFCQACFGAHWNADSDIYSVMDGYVSDPRLLYGYGRIESNGLGGWQATRDILNVNGSYSLLDLYLMGLVPSSAVPAIHLLTNPNLTNLANVTSTSVSTFSVLNITGGERVPSYPNAQTKFTLGFVVVKDTDFTPAEFAFFTRVAQYYTSPDPPTPIDFAETFVNPFANATGGRATMSPGLPLLLLQQPENYASVQQGASFQPGPLAPGSFLTVKGQFSNVIVDPNLINAQEVFYTMNGVSVQVDGTNIRMYYLGTGQINAAIPQSVTPGVHTLTVTKDASIVFTQKIMITAQNLAAFLWYPNARIPNTSAPIITNANYQLMGDPNVSSKYAQVKAGDPIIIWSTGGGATQNPLNDNTLVAPAGTFTFPAPEISLDGNLGSPLTVNYAGRAPGYFSLDQIVVTLPVGLSSGPHTLMFGNKMYRDAIWIK